MKLADLVEELKESRVYSLFMEENPDSFFSAGFIIFDLENKTEKIQLDFFIPEKKRMAAFEFPFNNLTNPKVHEDEILEMKEQFLDLKIDIDDIEGVSRKFIRENGSGINPTKIIAIISNGVWNLTCMNDSLGIVQLKLDARSGEEVSFKKGSLMDFMGFKKA